MNNQDLMPLFNPEKLAALNKELRGMSTNKARIFQAAEINKKPYCSPLTSMARLLSLQEICGCFHLKEGELFLSTNKETQDGTFRKEVGQLILQLIEKGFKEKDKLALYERCFKEAIQAPTNRYSHELSEIKSFRENVIRKEDWKNISLAGIAQLKQDIENFIETNSNKVLIRACLQILIRLDDIDKICNKLEKPTYASIRSLIKIGSFTNRYPSIPHLHCEVGAIERDSRTIDLQALALLISKKVKNKDFTISKFCCYLCHLVFKALQSCHPEGKNFDFNYLGNSSIIFPNYKTPFIKKDTFSEQVAQYLDNSLHGLMQDIKGKAYQIAEPSTIENSKLIRYDQEEYGLYENSEMIKKLEKVEEKDTPNLTDAFRFSR